MGTHDLQPCQYLCTLLPPCLSTTPLSIPSLDRAWHMIGSVQQKPSHSLGHEDLADTVGVIDANPRSPETGAVGPQSTSHRCPGARTCQALCHFRTQPPHQESRRDSGASLGRCQDNTSVLRDTQVSVDSKSAVMSFLVRVTSLEPSLLA